MADSYYQIATTPKLYVSYPLYQYASGALDEYSALNKLVDDIDTTIPESDTLLTSDNFYSQVIHKTNGGQLPFIFQPDKDDNTNFAIAKFDMDSFKFDQVANSVYNCKIRIREVWQHYT